MIYDIGLTAVLHLSSRPPSVANQSQNTQHFLPGLNVVRLPALLSLLLIYLIDYEHNPCILSLLQGGAKRLKRLFPMFFMFNIFFPHYTLLHIDKLRLP